MHVEAVALVRPGHDGGRFAGAVIVADQAHIEAGRRASVSEFRVEACNDGRVAAGPSAVGLQLVRPVAHPSPIRDRNARTCEDFRRCDHRANV